MNPLREHRINLNPNNPPSQREIAMAIGISTERLSQLERGGTNPGLEIARACSKFFGVDIDTLFPEDQPIPAARKSADDFRPKDPAA